MRSKNETDGLTFIERARRAQIIGCAMEVISEVGYPQTSIAKIAERVGVAKSAVLSHFKTKDDLVSAIVLDVFTSSAAAMVPVIASERSASAKLAGYIRSNAAFLDTHRTESIAMFEIMTSFRTADGRRLDQAAQDSVDVEPPTGDLAMLDPTQIFELGVRTGEFRSLSALFMKNALRAALDGAVSEVARDRDYDVLGYAEELVTTFDLATRRSS